MFVEHYKVHLSVHKYDSHLLVVSGAEVVHLGPHQDPRGGASWAAPETYQPLHVNTFLLGRWNGVFMLLLWWCPFKIKEINFGDRTGYQYGSFKGTQDWEFFLLDFGICGFSLLVMSKY